MKRLILFIGVYDTLDLFVYELKRELERLSYETMLFDVRKTAESLLMLMDFVKQPVKAAVTFNNLGFNMELGAGQNIWEQLGIPCVNILMDHPFCYNGALTEAPQNAIVLCTDRNHMRYIERFYPGIPVTGFLAHAGKETLPDRKPIAERSIDVLYAGGLSRNFAGNVMPDFSKFKFDVKWVCRRAYEDLAAHPSKTTEQALEESLLAAGIAMEDAELRDVIADLHFVDLYAVSHFREKTVQTLAEAGIRISLYGAGWDQCGWISLPNVYYGGRVPADEIVEKMGDAKIVLNTMTWFKDGTHDRVFNGMLQGAVAVTDTSLYMKEEFSEDELVFFELEELERLPEQIGELLSDPQRAQRIADAGYEKARKCHTWRNRAEELDTDLFSCI